MACARWREDRVGGRGRAPLVRPGELPQGGRVRARGGGQYQDDTQHHGPHGRAVGFEPGALVDWALGPAPRGVRREVALSAPAGDGDRPAGATRHRRRLGGGVRRTGAAGSGRVEARCPNWRRHCRARDASIRCARTHGGASDVVTTLCWTRSRRLTPAHGNAWIRHLLSSFCLLAGLAVGLAPKERRYAERLAPTTWVPRFLSRSSDGTRNGNSAVRRRC